MKVILSIPDEGYFRNASCGLIVISTYLLMLVIMTTSAPQGDGLQ